MSSSLATLIMQAMTQQINKSCLRCNKNTWHVESNNITHPPKYLIILVNRFSYIDGGFMKSECPIPINLKVELGPYKFSLQAIIDHHGSRMSSGHYTSSISCCGKLFVCNDITITEKQLLTTLYSSTAYIILYRLIT